MTIWIITNTILLLRETVLSNLHSFQLTQWGKVQVSEHPLSQIATAHISFFRAYFGLYTSTILRPAYQSLLRKMSSNIAMEFHGSSFAYSWNFMEFHLLAICEIPWNSMPILLEFHGTPAIHDSWNSMKFQTRRTGNPWNSSFWWFVKFHGFPD